MDPVVIIVRWLHIVSAALAVGVPLFMRFVLLPSLSTLDDATRGTFREAVHKRWRPFVHIMIVVFLATGFYNFLVLRRWAAFSPEDKRLYHMLFGIKVLIALVMFFLASALAGRSGKLQKIRENARFWVTVLVVCGLAVVAISGVMRVLDKPASTANASRVEMPAAG
jgi:uncharacterized membrane protein